ncbi:MAG: AraC family transcriptional regulator [Lachnospiraceae bacterium]|nr:AraC family transcriptional regulator [Lachnospiraceae bacterium]
MQKEKPVDLKRFTDQYLSESNKRWFLNVTLFDFTGHSDQNFLEYLEYYRIKLTYNTEQFWFCLTGLKKSIYHYIYQFTPEQYLSVFYLIRQQLTELTDNNGYSSEIFMISRNDNQIGILMSSDEPKCPPVQMAQMISDTVQSVYETYLFKGDTEYCNVTSLSGELHGLGENYNGYMQADILNQYAFFCMNTKVLTAERYQELHLPVSYSDVSRQLFHLSQAMETGKVKNCKQEYQKLFSKMLAPSFMINYVQDSLSYIKYYLQLQYSVREVASHPDLDRVCDVKSYFCLEKCKETVWTVISGLCDIIQKQGVYKNHNLRAAYYISEHYSEDISIVDVAEYVGVNYKYLSTIFPEDMGMSIRNYITKKRICAAKKMLLKSSVSVAQVAEAVGIHDKNYFTKLFKKETNMLPSEYKDSCNQI